MWWKVSRLESQARQPLECFLCHEIQRLRHSKFIISKIRKTINFAELMKAFEVIRCPSWTICGQHLVSYDYYYLCITTIVIFYTDSWRRLMHERFMTCKTISHGTWRWNGLFMGCYPPGGAKVQRPFHRECWNCLPWILSLSGLQSPNQFFDKRIIWDLKPKSLGCKYSFF